MARDDILSRDYVAPSRPIIQDTRKSEMWEKLLADSMDLLKMQTLSSQEIAREKRAEARDGRKSITDFQNAEALLKKEYDNRIREGEETWQREEDERIEAKFEKEVDSNRILSGKDLRQLTDRLKAMKDDEDFIPFHTRLDALIRTNENAIGVNRERSAQREKVATASDPDALATTPEGGAQARALIFERFPDDHLTNAGQFKFSNAEQTSLNNALNTTLRSIYGDVNLDAKLAANMKSIMNLRTQKTKIQELKTLNVGNTTMLDELNADLADVETDERNLRMSNVNIRLAMAAERGEATTPFEARIQQIKDTFGYDDAEAESYFNREVSGADRNTPEAVTQAQKVASATYGMPLSELGILYNELTKSKKAPSGEGENGEGENGEVSTFIESKLKETTIPKRLWSALNAQEQKQLSDFSKQMPIEQLPQWWNALSNIQQDSILRNLPRVKGTPPLTEISM